jgi:hypothetical protein
VVSAAGSLSDDVVVVAVSISASPDVDEPPGASPPLSPDAGAWPDSSDFNWSSFTHVSSMQSASLARKTRAKISPMPFWVSANHWVRRAKREAKKRLAKLD